MNRIVVCSLLALSLYTPSVFAKSVTPANYLIPGIIQQTQKNGLLCGPAAMETVLDYFGPDVEQRAIADVARTSSSGTYSFDIVRTGQFSSLSAAQGDYFQQEILTAGFPGRTLGFAAFGHNASTPWLTEAKEMVTKNIPVIMLMNFLPDSGSGGHYRVLVGYNDNLSEAYFIDPWGRNMGKDFNADGTVTWTYAEVISGWNYAEYGSDLPFWGAAFIPWNIVVSTKGRLLAGSTIVLTATITYPCPAPFSGAEFQSTQVNASIDLPAGMHLASGGNVVELSNLAPGQTASASWLVVLDDNPNGKSIKVSGYGLIQGYAPEACGTGNGDCYPAYSYTDRIGGIGAVTLTNNR